MTTYPCKFGKVIDSKVQTWERICDRSLEGIHVLYASLSSDFEVDEVSY